MSVALSHLAGVAFELADRCFADPSEIDARDYARGSGYVEAQSMLRMRTKYGGAAPLP
jgi:hypothetical protein